LQLWRSQILQNPKHAHLFAKERVNIKAGGKLQIKMFWNLWEKIGVSSHDRNN
jgi:hypothetical protein